MFLNNIRMIFLWMLMCMTLDLIADVKVLTHFVNLVT